MHERTLKIFISYAHDDQLYFQAFLKEVRLAASSSLQFSWQLWEDHQLVIGKEWHKLIQKSISEVDAAILLVSNGFLSSEYIRQHEFEVLLQRKREEGFLFFPVLFRPCRFGSWAELKSIQIFQPEGREFKRPGIQDLSYADLVEFGDGDLPRPDPMRDRYVNELVESIEEALLESKPAVTLSEKGPQTPAVSTALIPDSYRFTCDRIPQRDFFVQDSEKNKKRVRFYCLHGHEEQSPLGISKRFHYELTREINDSLMTLNLPKLQGFYREIEFADASNLEMFKINLISSVFENFGLAPESFAPLLENTFEAIVRNSPELQNASPNDVVTVYLRIIRGQWQEFIPAVVNWFINTFFTAGMLPAQFPSFYVFISLIYDEDADDKACDGMLKCMQSIENLPVLPVLDEVAKKHIIEWLRKHKTASTTRRRKELFAEYFEDIEDYDMEEVEESLGEIIDLLNQQRIDTVY
jgi:hypothetical protein